MTTTKPTIAEIADLIREAYELVDTSVSDRDTDDYRTRHKNYLIRKAKLLERLP